MTNVLVVAPHPDDETLGCGGTLLRHKDQGDRIHWLIMTDITENLGYSVEIIRKRKQEILLVNDQYGFNSMHNIELPTTLLDTIPMRDIVSKVSNVFKIVQPEIVYLPYRGDIHTDHAVVFDAIVSCTKVFRYPYIKKILVYETLSETDFGLNPDTNGFRPNVFVDISPYLEEKIKILNVYKSEVAEFPFPRSDKAIRSLAYLRGVASGTIASEAFMLLKERW